LDAHSQRGTESDDTDAVWVSDWGANAILLFRSQGREAAEGGLARAAVIGAVLGIEAEDEIGRD
jgi:hypothetical protein